MFNLGERTVGEEFRGAIQTNARHYLAEVDAVAVGYVGYVGYVDCGIYDRFTVNAGEGRDGPIITEAIEAVTGSIAFVAPREFAAAGSGGRRSPRCFRGPRSIE